MNYENREIPEGINVSEEHPLKDFFLLTGGLGAMIIVVVISLSFFAEWIVQYIPFEVELSLAEKFVEYVPLENDDNVQKQQYLQSLADKLALAQRLPEGMIVHLHYIDDEEVNAFATLGGHIMIHRGLMEKLPDENSLSMVIAHEIAHIKHRDPIIALGRGVMVAAILTVVTGSNDSALVQQFLGSVGLMTAFSFNREQETAADSEALDTLMAYYGHVNGADTLFAVLAEQQSAIDPPVFLSTHPHTEDRINVVSNYQKIYPSSGVLTPIAEALK